MNPHPPALARTLRSAPARSLALALALGVCAGSAPASAQSATPPDRGAPAVSADEIVQPLVLAAEADVGAGRAALATARAQLAQEIVDASSTWFVRAEGVRLLAAHDAGASPAPPPAPDEVLAPLLDAAEADVGADRRALAIARLDAVIARASPEGVLVARAIALRTAALEPASRAPSRPSGAGLDAADAADDAGDDVAEDADEDDERAGAGRPATPPDPTRRGDGELVELMITAGLFGAYAGFWVPFAAGLEGGQGREAGAANALYSVSVLVGGAAFALGALALDSGDGLRTGVAPSMSVGLRLGVLAGFLGWGAADRSLDPTVHCSDVGGFSCAEQRAGWTERTAFPFALGLGGLLTGAVVGYGLSPTIDQVRFVELQGTLWGTSLGLLLATVAQQGEPDDGPRGFALTAGGMGVGLLSTAIMAGLGANVSQARGWLMTVGFAAGLAAAALVSLVASAATGEMEAFPITFGGVGAAAGVAGLVVAGVLTDGMDRPRPATEQRASVDVRPTLSPLPGGASIGVNGRF